MRNPSKKHPPVDVRKFMRGALTISVWYENPSMKCKVSYGLWSIDLPRHIDELRSGLRGVADYQETKRLYKMITIEVNDMLRDYYLKYNQSGDLIQDGMMAEQFHFLPPPRIDTVLNTYNVQNGQVHIMSGATPTYVDRYAPYVEYLTSEDYEEKRSRGELESGCVYCVLN